MNLEERKKEFLEKTKPYEKNKFYTKGFITYLGEAIALITTEKKGAELFNYVKRLVAPQYIDNEELGKEIMDIYDNAHEIGLEYMDHLTKKLEGKE
jgi:hypothetical protein